MSSLQPVPISILNEISKLPGNGKCSDCMSLDISWGSVSHGTLICLDCAGKHRSLGVQTSLVKSIFMDHWSKENLEMLRQGGNQKLQEYFRQMDINENSIVNLYQTEAASHYRERLRERVRHILSQSPRTITRIPNSLKDFKRMNSSDDSCEDGGGGDDIVLIQHELHSVVFTEATLGFRLSKRDNSTAVVSRVTLDGYASRHGVQVGDSIWGVADKVTDDFDEILRKIASCDRPMSVFFYRDVANCLVENIAFSENVSNSDCTTTEGCSEVSDDDDNNDDVTSTTDSDSPYSNLYSENKIQIPLNFDFRVSFTSGPLGLTISQDASGRAEITAVTAHSFASSSGVKVGDFVVGAESQWFLNYDEAMLMLRQRVFPQTVVFRRVQRPNHISSLQT